MGIEPGFHSTRKGFLMENLNKQPKETQERAQAFDPVRDAVARNKRNERKEKRAKHAGLTIKGVEEKHKVTVDQQNQTAANASGYKKKSWM